MVVTVQLYYILGKKIFFMEKLLPLQSMILLKLPTTEVVKLNLVKNAYKT
jgi:hypothetical protein